MSWFHRIERKLEPFAIPNLALVIVAIQFIALISIQFLGVVNLENCLLVPALVLKGEWWRLLTFICVPPNLHYVWSIFALYVLYLFGTALENYWGRLRFNLFLFLGYVLTVSLAFITPHQAASNIFISGAIFLAFAYLNPDFVMHLFFVFPVKIKWLALLTWIFYAYMFFVRGLSSKMAILGAVGNFLIFFAKDIWLRVRIGRRQMQNRVSRDPARARHSCHVCGKTSLTHPQEDFRYCSKCEGDYCYCSEHLRAHEHVGVSASSKKTDDANPSP